MITETIKIKPNTILKLIKCKVLVAEITNDYLYSYDIIVKKESKDKYTLYTYEIITDDSLKTTITFDDYTYLEI